MPISLINGGAIGGAIQAFSGANLFLTGARTKRVQIGLEKTEIIPGDNESKPSLRKWSIYNEGPNVVFLFYGNAEEESHPLPPKTILNSKDSGGLGNRVSALSEGEGGFLKITIRGNFQEEEEEVPAPLIVKPFAPTGASRPEKAVDALLQKGFSLDDLTTLGQNQIDGLLDSDDFRSGFKFFELVSFQPGQAYTFKVKLASSFSDSYNLQLPLKCWALNPLKSLDLIAQIFYNQIDPSEINLKSQAWRLKQWVDASVQALPGEFSLAPDYGRRIFGLWAIDIRSGYENGLVWDFDSSVNEFSILGF